MQEQRVTILQFVSTKKIPAEGITREKNSCINNNRKKIPANWKSPSPPIMTNDISYLLSFPEVLQQASHWFELSQVWHLLCFKLRYA